MKRTILIVAGLLAVFSIVTAQVVGPYDTIKRLLDGTTIGATTPSTGAFTTLKASGITVVDDTLFVVMNSDTLFFRHDGTDAYMHISGTSLKIDNDVMISDADLSVSDIVVGYGGSSSISTFNDKETLTLTSNDGSVYIDIPSDADDTTGEIRLGDTGTNYEYVAIDSLGAVKIPLSLTLGSDAGNKDGVLNVIGSDGDTYSIGISASDQMTVTGAVSILVGIYDTAEGRIILAGGSGTADSYLKLENSADNDTVEESWILQPEGINLWLGPISDIDEFIFSNVGVLTLAQLTATGKVVGATGVNVGTEQDANLIDDTTTGAASTQLFIGNEYIVASGDIGSSVEAFDADIQKIVGTVGDDSTSWINAATATTGALEQVRATVGDDSAGWITAASASAALEQIRGTVADDSAGWITAASASAALEQIRGTVGDDSASWISAASASAALEQIRGTVAHDSSDWIAAYTVVAADTAKWQDGYDHSIVSSGNPHSVTPTELSLVIGTNVQAQDADLATLAAPTAWRVFYSNGSSVLTELALGADGTYLESNGASAAPTFTTPAGAGTMTTVKENNSGVGDADIGTIDFLGEDFNLAETPDTEIQIALSVGISDNNVVKIDGADIADDEYARFTASGLESRTAAEVLDNLDVSINDLDSTTVDSPNVADGELLVYDTTNQWQNQTLAETSIQPLDADLTTLATPTAWRVFYSDGSQNIAYVALGVNGTFLESNGTTTTPGFRTLADGDIPTTLTLETISGTPAITNGVAIGTDQDANKLDDATNGAGSTTLYIGNESILVSGDIGTSVLAETTIGIASGNLLSTSVADAADNEYARYTATGMESRTAGEVATDIDGSISNAPNLVETGTVATGTWSSDITLGTGDDIRLPASGTLTNGQYTGITMSVLSGYTSTAFADLVYLDDQSGTAKLEKTDSNAAASAADVMVGVALTVAAADAGCIILVQGTITHDAWNWTVAGASLWIDDGTTGTAGLFVNNAPAVAGDIVRPVAWVIDDDTIYFHGGAAYATVE